jgi:thymidine kinase
MFSGKSTSLLNQINCLKVYKNKILVINSKKDTRVENNKIQTHDGLKYDAHKVNDLKLELIEDILKYNYDTVCIDEAQFFNNLENFVKELLNHNIHVVVAGLNGDTNQQKFGFILDLIPIANKVTKLSGICTLCNDGTPGDFTTIKSNIVKTDQVLVGDDDLYICVCRKHINR